MFIRVGSRALIVLLLLAGIASAQTKINLATQVQGNLGVSHLNSGTSASSSTFWRGDGTWTAVGGVTSVTGSGNIASSGGATPNITFTGVLPIANGGTNSATQNWVDLTTNQSIAGIKTLTTGVSVAVTNPTLEGVLYTFANTPHHGVFANIVRNNASGLRNDSAVVGQIYATGSAPTTNIAWIGVTGAAKSDIAANEIYGMFGFADFEHSAAYGAGAIFVTRSNTLTDPGGDDGRRGVIIAQEGTYSMGIGLLIMSTSSSGGDPDNMFYQGALVKGPRWAGYRTEVFYDATSAPTAVAFSAAYTQNTGGADAFLQTYTDRNWTTIGDTVEQVYAWNSSPSGLWAAGSKAGAIKLRATNVTGGTEATLWSFNARNAGGDGYSNEVMTVSGTSTITAATFSGALSGNATTATTLQTARTIGLASFNGSADINPTRLNGKAGDSGATASNNHYLYWNSGGGNYLEFWIDTTCIGKMAIGGTMSAC